MQFTKQELIDSLAKEGLPLERGTAEQMVPQNQQTSAQTPSETLPQETQKGPEFSLFPIEREIMHLPSNVLQGVIEGGQATGNIPYNLIHAVNPKFAERYIRPDVNNYEGYVPGSKNPTWFGKGVQGLLKTAVPGTVGAALGGGGIGLLPGMLGGAAEGAALSPEEPYLGAAIGTGFGTLASAIPGTFRTGKNLLSATKSRIESLGKTLAEKGSEAAVAKIKAPIQSEYKEIFKETGPGSVFDLNMPPVVSSILGEIANKSQPAVNLVKQSVKQIKKVLSNSGLDDVIQTFVKNPNAANTNRLKSAVGGKIGDLKFKYAQDKYLAPEEQAMLTKFNKMYGTLDEAIERKLGEKSPELLNRFRQNNKAHIELVIPARNQQRLVEHHIKQPGNRVDTEKLSKSIENVSDILSLKQHPLSTEFLTIGDRLRRGLLARQEYLTPFYKSLVQAGAGSLVGFPLLGHYLNKRSSQEPIYMQQTPEQ